MKLTWTMKNIAKLKGVINVDYVIHIHSVMGIKSSFDSANRVDFKSGNVFEFNIVFDNTIDEKKAN